MEVGKLVEYEVFHQVLNHFVSNGLFHANHHGGLPNHSTTTALIQLHNIFLEAAQSKKLTAALLLDQSEAYDLLDHSILLRKLAVYNFDESSISWFRSYLSGRSQAVQIQTKRSPLLWLDNHAAPQGSVLGGLLFVLFENDFPACRSKGDSVMFVDDDTDCVSSCDLKELRENIQSEAQNSCDWLNDNRMVVAGQKSKLLVVSTRELKRKLCIDGTGALSVIVDGKQVFESQSERLLGITVNNSITWKDHLYGDGVNQGLIPQLSQRVGILRQLSKVASNEKLRNIAQGLFYSKLFYCLPLFVNTWGIDTYKEGISRHYSFTKKDLHKLQVLQNQVSRLLINRGPLHECYLSTAELLKLSGDLSVHQLGAVSTICLMKRVLMSGKPSYLAELIQNTISRGTRSGNTIKQYKIRLEVVKEGFLYRGIQLFNRISDDLKMEDSMVKFKRNVKKWVEANIAVKP